jgi:hypothetical protein
MKSAIPTAAVMIAVMTVITTYRLMTLVSFFTGSVRRTWSSP